MPVPGSPSSHTSPTFFLASAGQTALTPLHVSAMSHASAAGRHSWVAGRKAHVAEQQTPGVPFVAPKSHSSPGSTVPLPHGLGGTVVVVVVVVALEVVVLIVEVVVVVDVVVGGGTEPAGKSSRRTTRLRQSPPANSWPSMERVYRAGAPKAPVTSKEWMSHSAPLSARLVSAFATEVPSHRAAVSGIGTAPAVEVNASELSGKSCPSATWNWAFTEPPEYSMPFRMAYQPSSSPGKPPTFEALPSRMTRARSFEM